MIIDAKTIVVTLIIVGVAGYFGLQLIRSFALSIAQENHDANLATDMTAEAKRAKREREADAAAQLAFAKVEPLLPTSVVSKGMSLKPCAGAGKVAAAPKVSQQQAPSSGGLKISPANVHNEQKGEEQVNEDLLVDEQKVKGEVNDDEVDLEAPDGPVEARDGPEGEAEESEER
jgi:hypothetical protein